MADRECRNPLSVCAVTAAVCRQVSRHGVPERGEVGFLLWEEVDVDLLRTEVGSRLKTPLLPIWLTCCHRQYGVLFHLNRDLTRDYRAEHRSVVLNGGHLSQDQVNDAE